MLPIRILHLSDLHGNLKQLHKTVKSGQAFDWIVMTGDMPPTHVKYMTLDKHGRRIIDKEKEAAHQLEWCKNALKPLIDKIPHKRTIYVNGNHCFCNTAGLFDFTTFKGTQSFTLDGVKVGCAVGIAPLDFEWHEELPEFEFNELLNTLPKDIEVLVTHAPASQVLDSNYGGQHIGYDCLYHKLFGSALRNLDPHFTHLHTHLFGHAHESNGFKEIEVGDRNILFSNASCGGNVIEPDKPPERLGHKTTKDPE